VPAHLVSPGNLALSRALGDFEFKKNYSLGPEAQIITANPDITCHEISEDDEFLVLACDGVDVIFMPLSLILTSPLFFFLGIWDCLTSQQVVDFVRYQVSQDKALTEISEMMFDHCLAPDTTSGAGIGCDNMTILIVAITHGRTEEEWYQWVKERVKTNYGYQTPSALPQLYAQSRLLSSRARKEAQEARERVQSSNSPNLGSSFDNDDFLRRYGLTVTTLGGITHRPSNQSVSDGGKLMFASEDSEEEDSEEETGGRSFFSETLGLGRPESPDPTRHLKAQLDEYEKDLENEKSASVKDTDGDSPMLEPSSEKGKCVVLDFIVGANQDNSLNADKIAQW